MTAVDAGTRAGAGGDAGPSVRGVGVLRRLTEAVGPLVRGVGVLRRLTEAARTLSPGALERAIGLKSLARSDGTAV
ncbi:hypothetical protein [Streptomyces sp. NPDC005890]|uniref:hypothetical protein n=1 Tax=Streptomyces sp. NPDC005890 TaxID=3154568 RepID=UPI0033FC596F